MRLSAPKRNQRVPVRDMHREIVVRIHVHILFHT